MGQKGISNTQENTVTGIFTLRRPMFGYSEDLLAKPFQMHGKDEMDGGPAEA